MAVVKSGTGIYIKFSSIAFLRKYSIGRLVGDMTPPWRASTKELMPLSVLVIGYCLCGEESHLLVK